MRSSGSESYDNLGLLDDDNTSSMTSVDTSDRGVSKMEADFYYYGLHGSRKPGPKLIYRTSKDVFSPPSGPAQDLRMMQLLTVHDHPKLGKNELWTRIGPIVAETLKRYGIREYTSIDLARFRWEVQTKDGRGKTVTSAVTIWIGVRPDSTDADAAFDSTKGILELLVEFGIDDIDIAYRESEVQPLAGPTLYAPVNDFHPLRSVIDPLTTALSLPIAGLKTLHMEGTLGFYFMFDGDIYGVTARHVLFSGAEGNDTYSYNTSGQKKDVVLMGDDAFKEYLASIQYSIGTLNNGVDYWDRRIARHTTMTHADNQKPPAELKDWQENLHRDQVQITKLEEFHRTLSNDWSDVHSRIIGHVVWSPPIHGGEYTQDVCVIKLDKDKFLPKFMGNVLDLGPDIKPKDFMTYMNPTHNVLTKFRYPDDGLYRLQNILGTDQIKKPNNQHINGEPTRFVIKRGSNTGTVIGCVNGFESFTRQYGSLSPFLSKEVAVYPYDNKSGPFSERGDSGAAIVGANNDFVAQITSGAGLTDSLDITYGTPMEWLWKEVIKPQFPTATLFFKVPASK